MCSFSYKPPLRISRTSHQSPILPQVVSSTMLSSTTSVSMNAFLLPSLIRCPGDLTGVAKDSSTHITDTSVPHQGTPSCSLSSRLGSGEQQTCCVCDAQHPTVGRSPRARLHEASDGHLEDGVAKPITDTGAPHQGTLCCRHVLDGAQSRLPCWDDTMSTRAGQY